MRSTHLTSQPGCNRFLTTRKALQARLAAALAGSLMAACGGGGGPAGDPHTASVVISAQPANQAVVSGQSARFSVVATGSGSLSYQWRIDGIDVAGATSASFTQQALETSRDNAQVSVRISDSNGSKLSDPATLRVYSPANVPAAQLASLAVNISEAIDGSFGAHLVATNGAISPKGRLFVFLPTAATEPRRAQLILKAAANNGFHALGLAYPNNVTLSSACSMSTDPACLGNAREEVRTGASLSLQVAVNSINSIEHRLQRALQNLVAAEPAAGWDQYLDSSNGVRWDRLRLSGHAQGGGHAAYIAGKHAVDRACLFSAPSDWDELQGRPAAWISAPSATPASRIYAFGHQDDLLSDFSRLQTNWTTMGLAAFGPTALVDGAALSVYQGRHMLSTRLKSAGDPNNLLQDAIPVMDEVTPIDSGSGVPTYWPVWQYACFL